MNIHAVAVGPATDYQLVWDHIKGYFLLQLLGQTATAVYDNGYPALMNQWVTLSPFWLAVG